MKNVKYLIFDLDGTLFDYRKAAKVAMSEVYAKINSKHKIDLKLLGEKYSKILEEAEVYGWGEGKKSTEYRKERFEKLLTAFNITDKELTELLLKTYGQQLTKNTELFADTIHTLKHLESKYELVLATEGPPDAQNLSIDLLGIRKYFKRIFISGELGGKKNDGSFFKRVLHELSTNPQNTLVIGDSIKNDILGARIAGIDSIWVNRKNEENTMNIREVKDLNVLIEIL